MDPVRCGFRVMLPALLLLLFLAVDTESQTTAKTETRTGAQFAQPTTTTEDQYQVCQYSGSLDDRKSSLEDAYNADHIVDLIFVLDRSQSIKNVSFHKSIAFIRSLIRSQISNGQFILHPDYSRIALLSFGLHSTVVVDGILHSLFDACVFENKLSSLQLDNSPETHPTKAFTSAKTIFENSNRSKNSNKLKRVMWVFSDGDFRNEDEYNASVARESIVNELKSDLQVEIFVAGIGRKPEGWLDTKVKEENLKSFASAETTHYLCVEEWQQILNGSVRKPNETPSAELLSKIYGVSMAPKTDCETCSGEEKCACEVTDVVYECFDCSDDNSKDPQFGNVCPICVDGSCEEEDDDLMMYIIYTAAALGLILLIVIVGCCCCRCRGSSLSKEPTPTEECDCTDEEPVQGPELPPPPVPPRRPLAPRLIRGTNANYTNVEDWLQQEYEELVVETDLDRGQTEISQSDQQIEENERDMPGWSPHLNDLKNERGLLHLAIYSSRNTRWACTRGFVLSPGEIRGINDVFRKGPGHRAHQLKVAGGRYNLSQEDSSELHLHGKRPRRGREGSVVEESLRVAKAGEYIIAVVGASENALVPWTASELYHHLTGQGDGGFDSFIGEETHN